MELHRQFYPDQTACTTSDPWLARSRTRCRGEAARTAKLQAVMEILGLDMETVQPSRMKSALTVAARSISTSYRDVVTPDMLKSMLRSGQAPEQFQPHLMALLDETPLPVVVKAVTEAATPDVPTKKIMRNLHHWAKEWKACRAVC